MMKRLAIFALAVAITGCSKPSTPPAQPSQAAQIASLQGEVSGMRAELTTLQQIVEASAEKVPNPSESRAIPTASGAELQVTDGTQSYSRAYPTAQACETAKRATLAENDVREANRISDNAKHPALQQLSIVTISAYCLPRG